MCLEYKKAKKTAKRVILRRKKRKQKSVTFEKVKETK